MQHFKRTAAELCLNRLAQLPHRAGRSDQRALALKQPTELTPPCQRAISRSLGGQRERELARRLHRPQQARWQLVWVPPGGKLVLHRWRRVGTRGSGKMRSVHDQNDILS